MDEDLEVSPSLAEKRRRYFEARDKHLREKKGFRRLNVDTGPKGPQLVMVLLCLLGIALVSFQIFGPALYQTEDEDISDVFPGDEESTTSKTGIRLDPESMRSNLTRLELALFEPSESSFEGIVNELTAEVDRFLEYLRGHQEPREQALADDLDETAAPLRQESFDLEALEELRNRWMRLRARHFQQASWLHSASEVSTKDAEAAYAVYRDLADTLLRQVGSGLSSAEDAIEEFSAVGSLERDQPARDEILANWKDAAQSWHDDIDELRGSLPERPGTDAPADVLLAVHRLETALNESVERMPTDRLPTSEDLAAMEETLARAQFAVEAFDNLER